MSGGPEADPSLSAAPAGEPSWRERDAGTPPDEGSRRHLLSRGGGALAGAALLLVGCTSKVKQASNVKITKDTPGAAQDVELLNALLSLEYRSIAAYTYCIPLLPQPAPPPKNQSQPPPPPKPPSNQPPPPLVLMVPLSFTAAQTFLTQELAHVTELQGFIRQAGGHARKPEVRYAFGHPKTKVDALNLLHRTEQELLAAYLDVLSLLTPKTLRGAAAAIFANHAQHTTILRMELGLPPTPSAFVSRPE